MVLMVLSLTLVLLLPRLGSPERADLRRQARTLAGTLELVSEEAAMTGRTWRLRFLLDTQAIAVESQDDDGEFRPVRDNLADGLQVSAPVHLAGVSIADASPVREGEVRVLFPPQGGVDSLRLILTSESGVQCALRFDPVLARASVDGGDCG
jgi:type II secretory pathway pseudopilin PulG